jgi:hypothetical protein
VDPWVQTYRIRENQWFDNLDGRWEILHWEVDPEFTRFPYNEILQHRELYFIGRRAAEAAPSEPVSDILLQKWNTNFTTIPFARHSKTLAVELGRGGTLEKLVNRVRLVRDAEAVDALIKYIYLLEGKFPFEERFYYAGLYRTLTGKRHRLATPSPQRSSFWGRLLLTVTGVGFALRSPAIPRLIVRTLRKMGINVGWTYRMLKRLLFRER